MNKFLQTMCICAIYGVAIEATCIQEASETSSQTTSLLNSSVINSIAEKCAWKESHGADDSGALGAGLFYYSIVHMKKAKLSVCLGSGGGFVPMMMKQAQRDLGLSNAKTVLVDGNMGGFGRPKWMSEDSHFRINYPDIEILIDSTANIAKEKQGDWKIDYLHIDADHSFEGAMKDFRDYLPLMSKNGIITFHDTGTNQCKLGCRLVIPALRKEGFNIVNFYDMGGGFAMLQLGDIDVK